ncbi:hypothetical protein N5D28_20645 [Stutzerimonas stutzeri]|uniref:hypothetical protein n=1 Tax=Stutzerimonas stutzeri TaxID=316 RepID=UPI002446AE21|nr:hypothetical protein [Stutzerimonas stutzeri]MDH0611292.1 hypothetical protein [Stutzerimonas stutzeri]
MIACVTALELSKSAQSLALKGPYPLYRHTQWQYQLHMQQIRQKKGAKLLITLLISNAQKIWEGAPTM